MSVTAAKPLAKENLLRDYVIPLIRNLRCFSVAGEFMKLFLSRRRVLSSSCFLFVGFVTFRWKFRCVWDVQGAFGKLTSQGLSPLALAADETSARGQRSKWAEVFANFNEPGGEEMHCGGSSLCSHVGWRCYCDTLAPSYSCQCCVQVQSGFLSVKWRIKAAVACTCPVVLRENHHINTFYNKDKFSPKKKQAKRKFDLFFENQSCCFTTWQFNTLKT